MDPDRVLVRGTLSEPHRFYTRPVDREEDSVRVLSAALKEMLRKELLDRRATPSA